MLDLIKSYLSRGNGLPPKEKAHEKVMIALEIILVVLLILELTNIVDSVIINAAFIPALIIYAFMNVFKVIDKAKIISLILIFIISLSIYAFALTVL